LGREGQTSVAASADWDHDMESSVTSTLTLPLGGAKDGFDMEIQVELFMSNFADITDAAGGALDLSCKNGVSRIR